MVPVARAFTRACLGSHPRAADAEVITSEYAGNTIRYGRWGTNAIMHVTVATARNAIRIEITDAPADTLAPSADELALDDEGGRGFLIVDALATQWGHHGVGGGQLTAWAEI
jgi:anti-sigma regulatory factor (Ser/Thr protein kinase)